MTQPLSLLDFLRGLQTDAAFRSEFSADPESTIADHGLSDLSPYDVHDALVLMEDNETADFSHDFGAGAVHWAVHHLPPPPPVHPAGGEQQAAVQYLSDYVATAFTGQAGLGADAFDQDADLDLLSAPEGSSVVDGEVIGDADAGFGEGDPTSAVIIGSAHISSTGLDATGQPLGHVDEASLLDGFGYGYGDSEPPVAGVDRFGEADHTAGEEHGDDGSHPPVG